MCIRDSINKPGLVNLDFADIKTVIENGGLALIGVGEADGEERAMEAVEKALKNPLLEVDTSEAKGALVNVTGGKDLTLQEAEEVVRRISEALTPDAQIIWGAQLNDELEGRLRVLLIISGVRSPYAVKKEEKAVRIPGRRIDLGITYI